MFEYIFRAIPGEQMREGREYRLAENGERGLERGRETAKQPATEVVMWEPRAYIYILSQTKEGFAHRWGT